MYYFFNSKNNNIENEVPYCCWLEMLVGVPYWGKWATWICWFWTRLNDLGAWMDPTQWLCTWEEGIGIRNLCALRYTLCLDFVPRLYFFNFPLNCGSKNISLLLWYVAEPDGRCLIVHPNGLSSRFLVSS